MQDVQPRKPTFAALLSVGFLVLIGAASASAQSTGAHDADEPAERRWWLEFGFGLANPTSDLGKINDSGPLFMVSAGRRLRYPFSLRTTVAHTPLGRGGTPQNVPWPEGPVGPRTDLWLFTAGPSLNLVNPNVETVDLTWTACVGFVRWESGGSDLSDPFTDTDPTGCLFMDAALDLSRRISVNTHLSGYLIPGSASDSNPYETEFLHGFGIGLRIHFR